MAGNADNVIVGSATLYVAPLGTDLPDLTVYPISWPTGWEATGFTDDGMQVDNSATVKNIDVDELTVPVQRILDKEDAKVTSKFAEATLANINRVLSTATLHSPIAAGPTNVGSRKVSFGGGTLKYFMLGFEGPGPDGALARVFLGYKVLPQGNVSFAHKRTDKVVLNAEFGLVADTTRSAGDDVWSMTDITEQHTT